MTTAATSMTTAQLNAAFARLSIECQTASVQRRRVILRVMDDVLDEMNVRKADGQTMIGSTVAQSE